ncbi:hypothetical protein ACFE04_031998 [Oxalis oulophora]
MSLPLRFGTLIMSYRNRHPCLPRRLQLFEVQRGCTYGKRQARALAVFLNSQGVIFNVVYSSPMDWARYMAADFCRVMALYNLSWNLKLHYFFTAALIEDQG